MLRLLLIFILNLFLLATSTLASEGSEVFARLGEVNASDEITTKAIELEADILSFEQNCLDVKGNIDPIKLNATSLVDCETEAEYLVQAMTAYEKQLTEEEINTLNSICRPQEDQSEIERLTDAATLAASHVECRKDQIALQNESCGKVFACNIGRSVVDLTTSGLLIPKSIKKKIRGYAYNQLNNLAGECAQEGDSNCIKEFVNNLVASLLSTASAMWDLVKTGVKSLFDLSSYFSDKSDKAHQAMNETVEDVEGFLDNPMKWIQNKISFIKKSVDGWIKETVLCQKWEGEPHLSKCEVPLYSYDCIDCETRVNAFCAGIGAIVSEVGIAVLTAGAGTMASIGARAGGLALRTAAKKAAKKIKIKKPTVAVNLSSKSGVANKVALATANTFKATANLMKDKIASISTALDEVRKIKAVSIAEKAVVSTTKAITKTVETIADPTTAISKITEKSYIATAKVMAKSSNKNIKAIANLDLNQAKKAKFDDVARRNFREKTKKPSKVRLAVAANKIYKKYEKSKNRKGLTSNNVSSHNERPSESFKYKKDEIEVTTQNHRPSHTDKESVEIAKKDSRHEEEQDSKHNSETNYMPGIGGSIRAGTAFALSAAKINLLGLHGEKAEKRENMRKKSNELSSTPLESFRSQNNDFIESRIELDKTAQSTKTKKDPKEKQSKNKEKSREKSKEKIVKNNRSNKKNYNSKTSTNRARFTSQDSPKIENDQQLAQMIGVSDKESFKDERSYHFAKQRVDTLSNIYNDSNKEHIVSKMMSMNKSMKKETADKLFRKRQAEVNAAKAYMERNKITAEIRSIRESLEKKDDNKVQVDSKSQKLADNNEYASKSTSTGRSPASRRRSNSSYSGSTVSSPSNQGFSHHQVAIDSPESIMHDSMNKALNSANEYKASKQNKVDNTKLEEAKDSKVTAKNTQEKQDIKQVQEDTLYDEFANLFEMMAGPEKVIGKRPISVLPKKIMAEEKGLFESLKFAIKNHDNISMTEVFTLNSSEIHKHKIGDKIFYMEITNGNNYKLITQNTAEVLINNL